MSRDAYSLQTGLRYSPLYSPIGPDSVHELIDDGKCSRASVAHSDRHLHDVETSRQHACARQCISDAMGKVQILAVHIGIPRCKRFARRLKSTGHWDNVCILDETPQNRMWCTPLCDRDFYTRTVDLLGAGWWRAGASDI